MSAQRRPAAAEPAWWLMKSEPDVFSFDDLRRSPGKTAPWDGVRNYQARNFLRDRFKPGDRVFFYHSSCAEPGIAGIAEVAGPARPDPTQWDPASPFHDPTAPRDPARWWLVDVRWVADLARPVPLALLRSTPGLEGLLVLQKGQRLSVQPVEPAHAKRILSLAGFQTADREVRPPNDLR